MAMALFSRSPRPKNERAPVPAAPPPAEAAPAPSAAQKERRIIGVLLAPHLTEKTNAAAGQGWYTFQVRPDANKIMVKQAVEDRYGVGVRRVRILAARSKRVRLGRITGRNPGFKKAMVKVEAGQSIEFT